MSNRSPSTSLEAVEAFRGAAPNCSPMWRADLGDGIVGVGEWSEQKSEEAFVRLGGSCQQRRGIGLVSGTGGISMGSVRTRILGHLSLLHSTTNCAVSAADGTDSIYAGGRHLTSCQLVLVTCNMNRQNLYHPTNIELNSASIHRIRFAGDFRSECEAIRIEEPAFRV